MTDWPWHLSSTKSWPASGTTLKSGFARLIAAAAARGVTLRHGGAPGIRVNSSAFTGRSHVESITVDYTGAAINFDALTAARHSEAPFPSAARDEVAARTDGIIDEVRLRAEPITVNGVEVRVDAHAVSLPVDWIVVRHEGELYGTAAVRRDPASRAAGSFRVSLSQEGLAQLIADSVRAALKNGAKWTASLKALKIKVTPSGEGRQVVTLGAKGKIFFVPLSGRLGLDLSISPDGILTINRATAASKSLLSKLILLPLRAQLRGLAGRSYPLVAGALAAGNVSVDAADGRLTVSGSIRGA